MRYPHIATTLGCPSLAEMEISLQTAPIVSKSSRSQRILFTAQGSLFLPPPLPLRPPPAGGGGSSWWRWWRYFAAKTLAMEPSPI